MTKVRATLAGLDEPEVQSAFDRLQNRARDLGVGADAEMFSPATPTDLKESLSDGGSADASSLWVYSLPERSRWDFHGEACRRIVDEEDQHPKLSGAYVALSVRYGAGVVDAVKGMHYPDGVTAVLSGEDAPPAVVHSAPFSYSPFHDYYTEVHNETGGWE